MPRCPSCVTTAERFVSFCLLFCIVSAEITTRVAAHLENLEKSGNLRVVRKNRKSQGKCVLAFMKFGQFVLRKITTRCQILRLKCTKFDFGWGSTPDPAGGAYSTPPGPVAGFKGAYF